MILSYLKSFPLLGVWLCGTPWVVLLTYIPRFLPLGLWSAQAALARLDPVMDEAARAEGGRFLQRLAAITAPLLGPAAVGAGIYETIGVLTFSFNEGGNSADAPAVSMLCLILVFTAAGLITVLPASSRLDSMAMTRGARRNCRVVNANVSRLLAVLPARRGSRCRTSL
jgi:iron(III) transport system permease protein